MPRLSHCMSRLSGWVAMIGVLFSCAGLATAADTRQATKSTRDELWRQGVTLATEGEFQRAADTIKEIDHGGSVTGQVRAWLEEYTSSQAKRRELDRADVEKYVGYAKARIERKEYDYALRWALRAADCAEDRDAFLASDWLDALVNDALTVGDKHRAKHEWREAWDHYWRLSQLFDREPRYRKLEREVLTQLRLDTMFTEKTHWEERIEKVRWEDAETALEYIELSYVKPPDFRAIAESGLEQLLLLLDSKTARETFAGLKNEDDRKDFEVRVRQRLEQIRSAPSVDRKAAVRHFRRVVKKINPQTIRLPDTLVVSELMRGALEPLDDFTTIIWPQETKEFEKHTRGDFIGVGISIQQNRATEEIEVVTPLEGASAYRAGIQAGDVITHVDGTKIKGMSINKVVDIITGPKDTEVTLTIRRGEQTLEFPLTRTKVKIQSVKGLRRNPLDEERWDYWLDRNNGIAYVRITNFQRNTVEDFQNVMSELGGRGVRGLVLDLRGNPGGLLDSAWRMSSLFLNRGDMIVTTKGRHPNENQEFPAPTTGAYAGLPINVLVDENSASASEILAGAVRDNHHGVVVGARTFGKFSVQNLIPLGRSNAKLKITTAKYYIPSGVSLHREPNSDVWGVEPDIPVRLVRWEKVNLYKLRRERDLLGPPKPQQKKEEAEADAEDDDPKDEKAAAEGKDGDDKEKTADADSPREDELPPLEQPDENTRPVADPQLDTALLLMRIKLLGAQYPTLATADIKSHTQTAKP